MMKLSKSLTALLDKVVYIPTIKVISLALALFQLSCLPLMAQERAGTTAEGHQLVPLEVKSEVDRVRAKGGDIDRFPMFRYHLNEGAIPKLKIGDSIPEALWNIPLAVLHRTDTVHTVRLNNYRNRDLIILDNWTYWCGPCVASMIKWEKLAKENPHKIALLGVYVDYTYAALPYLKKTDWKSLSVYGLDANVLNRSFFRSIVASRLVWIYKGRLFAITGTKSYEIDDVLRLINGVKIQIESDGYEIY